MAANYAADADSIYGPQQAAEQATLDQSNKQTMAGYDQSQAKIDKTKEGYNAVLDPYAQAIQKSLEDKNAGVDKNNFDASQSGLMGSGLLGNQQRILGHSYISNVNQTEAERAAKLADISTARSNATDTYNTNVGALRTKYTGLKNEYVTSKQQADSERAANTAALQKSLSGYGSSGGGAAAKQNYSGVAKWIEQNAKTNSWGAAAKQLKAQGYDPALFDQAFKRIYGQQQGNMKKYGYDVNAEKAAIKKYGG